MKPRALSAGLDGAASPFLSSAGAPTLLAPTAWGGGPAGARPRLQPPSPQKARASGEGRPRSTGGQASLRDQHCLSPKTPARDTTNRTAKGHGDAACGRHVTMEMLDGGGPSPERPADSRRDLAVGALSFSYNATHAVASAPNILGVRLHPNQAAQRSG